MAAMVKIGSTRSVKPDRYECETRSQYFYHYHRCEIDLSNLNANHHKNDYPSLNLEEHETVSNCWFILAPPDQRETLVMACGNHQIYAICN